MRISILIITLLGGIACQEISVKNTIVFSQKTESSIDSLKNRLLKQFVISEVNNLLDTHFTPNSNYYQFFPVTDSTYKIVWGNDSIKNISTDLYYAIFGIRQSLDSESNDFIIVKGWTGSDSKHVIVLPIKQNTKEFIIFNPLTKDIKRGLVVSECVCQKDTILKVIDLKTRVESYIEDDQINCNSAFIHYCIESIEIKENNIVVSWALPNRIDEPHKFERKKYKIYAR